MRWLSQLRIVRIINIQGLQEKQCKAYACQGGLTIRANRLAISRAVPCQRARQHPVWHIDRRAVGVHCPRVSHVGPSRLRQTQHPHCHACIELWPSLCKQEPSLDRMCFEHTGGKANKRGEQGWGGARHLHGCRERIHASLALQGPAGRLEVCDSRCCCHICIASPAHNAVQLSFCFRHAETLGNHHPSHGPEQFGRKAWEAQ